MDTATQIERLKQLEETINQRFEEQLRKRDYITYQEFLDEFINPFLPIEMKIIANGVGWVKSEQSFPLDFENVLQTAIVKSGSV